MKLVKIFHDQVEAQMAKALLESNGFTAELQGAKDYITHVLGGGTGKFSLMVPEQDFIEVRELLDSVHSDSATPTPNPPNHYFRRAVMLAFAAALILPVVFNIGSLLQLHEFWKRSEKTNSDKLKVAIVVLLQLLSLGILILVVRHTGLLEYLSYL